MTKLITSSLSLIFFLFISSEVMAQENTQRNEQKQEINLLIDKYVQARESKDSVLLESILTSEIDQLVSSGKWRHNQNESMKGMLQSSRNNPGSRKIIVEKIRFVNSGSAIVDTRYEIGNTDGTIRKMWSTFIVVYLERTWKITAIRNMLPASNR